MQSWFQFYAVTGGAATTLLGLLFVSVSINSAATLDTGTSNSKHLAEQAFQNYYAVIVVSLLALFPQVSKRDLGLAVVCLTSASAGWVLVGLCGSLARPRGESARRGFSDLPWRNLL